MAPDSERLTLSVVDDIRSVDADQWNRLARRDEYSPFLEHEFLASIEASGAAAPETGWFPRHLVLRDSSTIIAAAPAWGRTHSMGEFVFDQGLAEAARELGRDYYPKLTATLPFTPSPGYRFLIDPDYDQAEVCRVLLDGLRSLRESLGMGVFSLLFVDPDWEPFIRDGFDDSLRWAHQYYIWRNRGYADFEDYVSRFRKSQRRNIRRERSSIDDQGLRIRRLEGDDIDEAVMDRMFDFYRSTNENFGPWAAFFLNREWFRDIGRRWAHRIVLFAAYPAGVDEPIAMSFLIRKGRTLIGRYWGADRFVRNLHFELCYYAPIEFAINDGIDLFDPGMGSPHKTRRGFESREYGTYHEFDDETLRRLFRQVLPEANRMERDRIDELDRSVPWRRDLDDHHQ